MQVRVPLTRRLHYHIAHDLTFLSSPSPFFCTTFLGNTSTFLLSNFLSSGLMILGRKSGSAAVVLPFLFGELGLSFAASEPVAVPLAAFCPEGG